jgi:lipopolysaccharide/colanic/teichoic acid biosynthesis glycosyltransferase
MKRLMDIVASLTAVLLLSPLLVPVLLILRFTGEGEIFYRQERIGRNGRRFSILKFATMLKNSPNMTGGDITVTRDPRVLPFGHYLRRSKINELPQLFNILLGDMSLIGPRPLTPRVATMFSEQHWHNVAALRPGLSGLSSIVFRDEEALLSSADDRQQLYADAIVPYKMALESYYAARQSLWLDIQLIVLTLVAVARPRFDIATVLPDLPPPPPALQALRAKNRAVPA